MEIPLTLEERRALSTRNDVKAWRAVAGNYALIAAAFAAPALWPHPIAFVVGALILGGRMLSLGIMTHDAAHRALFVSPKLNDWAGRWILGALPNVPLHEYRRGHLDHHRFAGTEHDPDVAFVAGYPAPGSSLLRKFARDLLGVTGAKNFLFQARTFRFRKQAPFLLAHAVLFGVLWASGFPALYLLWWAAYFFVFPAVMRLRQMGEHGAVADHFSRDPRLNTRTTLPSLLERLIVAPNDVHYHLEHHLLPFAPPYNLARAHKLLKARGFYDGFDCVARGYGSVIAKCLGPPDAALRARFKPRASLENMA